MKNIAFNLFVLFVLFTIIFAPSSPLVIPISDSDVVMLPESLKGLLNCSICEDLTGYLEPGIFVLTNEDAQQMEVTLFT